MKAFIRYGSSGVVISGTLVRAKVVPVGEGWVEVPYTLCCSTLAPLGDTLNGVYKAFVKYDGRGTIVSGSTIIRRTIPSIGTWREVPYRSCCGVPGDITYESLLQLISVAESEIVPVSTNGDDILPTLLWTTAGVKSAFDAVILSAKDVSPSANVFTIRDVYNNLSEAIATYNQQKNFGTTPNKSTLVARIGVANTSKVTTSTNGNDVLPSDQWTTTSTLNTLNAAISSAQSTNVSNAVTQNQVNTAVTTLNNAITAYNNAKQSGTTPNKTTLVSRIAAANATKVVSSTNGNTVLPSDKWVTTSVNNTFDSAISAAELVNVTSGVTQVQVDGAVTTLNSAISAYESSKQNGTTPNKVPLVSAINAANDVKVVTSTDGSDVPTSEQWVTSSVQTSLSNAIATAEGVNSNSAVTQSQVTSATTALNNAVITYNGAKQQGLGE